MEKNATTATASGVAIANSANRVTSSSVLATLTKQSPQIPSQSTLVVISKSHPHDQDGNRRHNDAEKEERLHFKHNDTRDEGL
jgi:hypothetical protein